MVPEIVNGLFAIGGAVLGVAGTWLVAHRFKERKRIAVIVSPLARLLDVGNQVKSEVKVLYRDQEVDCLSTGEIALQNSGNVPVEDLQATVSAETDSAIIDFEVGSANFSFDSDSLQLEGDDSCRTVNIEYLNPDDRVVLSYKLTGRREVPVVAVRKLGVEVVTRRDYIGWIPDIYAEVVYASFSRLPLFNLVGRMVRPYNLYLEARKKLEPGRAMASKPLQQSGSQPRNPVESVPS